MTTPPDRSLPGALAAVVAGVLVGSVALPGCTAPAFRADFGSTRTFQRVPALVDAASPAVDTETPTIETLVGQLNDPDPAVRLFAIGALQRRSNERFGYRWYRDAEGRREAVEAWESWAASAGGGGR